MALDIHLTDELVAEGIARELVNRIQNIRKDKDFDITDKINVKVQRHEYVSDAIGRFGPYICAEVLADSLVLADVIAGEPVEMTDELQLRISVEKI